MSAQRVVLQQPEGETTSGGDILEVAAENVVELHPDDGENDVDIREQETQNRQEQDILGDETIGKNHTVKQQLMLPRDHGQEGNHREKRTIAPLGLVSGPATASPSLLGDDVDDQEELFSARQEINYNQHTTAEPSLVDDVPPNRTALPLLSHRSPREAAGAIRKIADTHDEVEQHEDHVGGEQLYRRRNLHKNPSSSRGRTSDNNLLTARPDRIILTVDQLEQLVLFPRSIEIHAKKDIVNWRVVLSWFPEPDLHQRNKTYATLDDLAQEKKILDLRTEAGSVELSARKRRRFLDRDHVVDGSDHFRNSTVRTGNKMLRPRGPLFGAGGRGGAHDFSPVSPQSGGSYSDSTSPDVALAGPSNYPEDDFRAFFERDARAPPSPIFLQMRGERTFRGGQGAALLATNTRDLIPDGDRSSTTSSSAAFLNNKTSREQQQYNFKKLQLEQHASTSNRNLEEDSAGSVHHEGGTSRTMRFRRTSNPRNLAWWSGSSSASNMGGATAQQQLPRNYSNPAAQRQQSRNKNLAEYALDERTLSRMTVNALQSDIFVNNRGEATRRSRRRPASAVRGKAAPPGAVFHSRSYATSTADERSGAGFFYGSSATSSRSSSREIFSQQQHNSFYSTEILQRQPQQALDRVRRGGGTGGVVSTSSIPKIFLPGQHGGRTRSRGPPSVGTSRSEQSTVVIAQPGVLGGGFLQQGRQEVENDEEDLSLSKRRFSFPGSLFGAATSSGLLNNSSRWSRSQSPAASDERRVINDENDYERLKMRVVNNSRSPSPPSSPPPDDVIAEKDPMTFSHPEVKHQDVGAPAAPSRTSGQEPLQLHQTSGTIPGGSENPGTTTTVFSDDEEATVVVDVERIKRQTLDRIQRPVPPARSRPPSSTPTMKPSSSSSSSSSFYTGTVDKLKSVFGSGRGQDNEEDVVDPETRGEQENIKSAVIISSTVTPEFTLRGWNGSWTNMRQLENDESLESSRGQHISSSAASSSANLNLVVPNYATDPWNLTNALSKVRNENGGGAKDDADERDLKKKVEGPYAASRVSDRTRRRGLREKDSSGSVHYTLEHGGAVDSSTAKGDISDIQLVHSTLKTKQEEQAGLPTSESSLMFRNHDENKARTAGDVYSVAEEPQGGRGSSKIFAQDNNSSWEDKSVANITKKPKRKKRNSYEDWNSQFYNWSPAPTTRSSANEQKNKQRNTTTIIAEGEDNYLDLQVRRHSHHKSGGTVVTTGRSAGANFIPTLSPYTTRMSRREEQRQLYNNSGYQHYPNSVYSGPQPLVEDVRASLLFDQRARMIGGFGARDEFVTKFFYPKPSLFAKNGIVYKLTGVLALLLVGLFSFVTIRLTRDRQLKALRTASETARHYGDRTDDGRKAKQNHIILASNQSFFLEAATLYLAEWVTTLLVAKVFLLLLIARIVFPRIVASTNPTLAATSMGFSNVTGNAVTCWIVCDTRTRA
ncbi:unnamed protein product [Amoebophrya sp. A120]|nr:unnamed protein product [Amoebophrya sp. A120]|eukprot:GSA120T00008285001.1